MARSNNCGCVARSETYEKHAYQSRHIARVLLFACMGEQGSYH
jgi:hypothetical protein